MDLFTCASLGLLFLFVCLFSLTRSASSLTLSSSFFIVFFFFFFHFQASSFSPSPFNSSRSPLLPFLFTSSMPFSLHSFLPTSVCIIPFYLSLTPPLLLTTFLSTSFCSSLLSLLFPLLHMLSIHFIFSFLPLHFLAPPPLFPPAVFH